MNKNIFYDMLLNKLKNTDYKSYYSNTINGFDLIFEDKEFEKILKTPVKIMVSKSTQTCKLNYETSDSSDSEEIDKYISKFMYNSNYFSYDSDDDVYHYDYAERQYKYSIKLLNS